MSWNIFGYDVFETIIELLIIWLSVFLAFRFLQGTRGGGVIRGLIVLLAPLWLLQMLADTTGQFQRLDFFAEQFLTYVVLLLIIIFQPELRQAALRVSQSGLFSRFSHAPTIGDNTITSIAPDLIKVSVILSASSPLSGCETIKLSKSTPTTLAYLGSSACSTSTNTAFPPFLCASAITLKQNVVLPEDSGP